jgi:hypothetical protein
MSNKKLLAILLLNAPSYGCIGMFQFLEATNNEAVGWLFFLALIPGGLFWLAALLLCIWETIRYLQRARAGSTETIAFPVISWLLTLPMGWIIMNFAAIR